MSNKVQNIMNVSTILQRSVGTALGTAFRKLYDGLIQQPNSAASAGSGNLCPRTVAARPVGAVPWSPDGQRRLVQKPRPLRVLHFIDSSSPRTDVGRMVMSGSMADVCAELDRLVAQEATLH